MTRITTDIDLQGYAPNVFSGRARHGGAWIEIVFEGHQLRLSNVGPAAAATLRDAFAMFAAKRPTETGCGEAALTAEAERLDALARSQEQRIAELEAGQGFLAGKGRNGGAGPCVSACPPPTSPACAASSARRAPPTSRVPSRGVFNRRGPAAKREAPEPKATVAHATRPRSRAEGAGVSAGTRREPGLRP